jgi:hypothetical protein
MGVASDLTNFKNLNSFNGLYFAKILVAKLGAQNGAYRYARVWAGISRLET